MFITKSIPTITEDGKIKPDIEIRNGVLWIDTNIKFENSKWYSLGDDGKWYFLGYGANPSIEVMNENVLNQRLFNDVFEEVDD